MNCVANILHKICNASVFFSAYRTAEDRTGVHKILRNQVNIPLLA